MSKQIIDNFNLLSKIPLDKRTSVNNLSDIQLPYEGLFTYEKQSGRYYYYKNGAFVDYLNEINQDIINLGNNVNTELTNFENDITTELSKTPSQMKNTLMYNRALKEMNMVSLDSLKNALKAVNNGTINIAMVGDSITDGSGLFNTDDCYPNRFLSKLKNLMPNTNISFQNFALGGRYITLLNSTEYKGVAIEPTTNVATGFFRPWSVLGKSWKDSVKDFAPDLLFVAFGMNEGFGNSPLVDSDFATQLTSLINFTKTWTKVPNIVLVTTILPTKDNTLYSEDNEVVKAIVRTTRAYAKENNIAICDSSRLFQILRDGVDELTTSTTKEIDFANFPSGWSSTSPNSYSVSNGVLSCTNGGDVFRDKDFYNGSISVNLTHGQSGDSGTLVVSYRNHPTYGHFLVQVGAGSTTGYVRLYSFDSTSYTLLQQVENLSVPIGSNPLLTIVVKDNEHYVALNGVALIAVKTFSNMHTGKIMFASRVSPYGTFSNLKLGYNDFNTTDPLYSEKDLMGENISPYDNGNGINHPTPLAHNLCYYPSTHNIINELTHRKETGLFMPTRILSGSLAIPDGSYVPPSGYKLYYYFVSGNYNKERGIRLIRRDTGVEYTLSVNTISQATTNLLGATEFAYYKVSGSDIVIVCVPTASTLTWDLDLYRFS